MAEAAFRMRQDKDLYAGRPQHESEIEKAVLNADSCVLEEHSPEQQEDERNCGAKAEEIERDAKSSALHRAPPKDYPNRNIVLRK